MFVSLCFITCKTNILLQIRGTSIPLHVGNSKLAVMLTTLLSWDINFHFRGLNRRWMYGNGYSMAIMLDYRSTATSYNVERKSSGFSSMKFALSGIDNF